MKALDTNLLVRFLVRDDEKQAKAVYRRFKKAEADREVLFVSTLVVLELFWVLESVYEISRGDILDSLDALMAMPILNFETQAAVRSCAFAARESKTDLSDLLIAHQAISSGCNSIITFDKKAAKDDLFEMLH